MLDSDAIASGFQGKNAGSVAFGTQKYRIGSVAIAIDQNVPAIDLHRGSERIRRPGRQQQFAAVTNQVCGLGKRVYGRVGRSAGVDVVDCGSAGGSVTVSVTVYFPGWS
jgi:hypothetical protein